MKMIFNSSTGMAESNDKDFDPVKNFLDNIGKDDRSPTEIWESQPLANEYEGLKEGNRQGRRYDKPLPYDIHISREGKIDADHLTNTWENRINQPLPEDFILGDVINEDEAKEANALGMDLKQYKNAREQDVPHNFLRHVFQASIRKHAVQTGQYKNKLVGNEPTDFENKIENWEANNPSKELANITGNDLEASSGFVPMRMGAMNPSIIASAYKKNISADDLLDAWHNNGYHPLRAYGYDHPIEHYVSTREMGTDHDQAKEILSSLQFISPMVYKHLTNKGIKHDHIIDRLNPYKGMEIAAPARKSIDNTKQLSDGIEEAGK